MFTFCWENKFLIRQSTKIFSVKTGFEELKKKLKKKFGDPRNFGGSDATNELNIWIFHKILVAFSEKLNFILL